MLQAACGTANVRPTETFDPTMTYLYGRFQGDGRSAISFEIRCRTGKTYRIGFSEKTPLQVIKLPPGKCQFEDLRSGDHYLGAAWFRLIKNEVLEAGGVYYIGDFAAGSKTKVVFKILYSETHLHWAVGRLDKDYAGATAELKQAYPALAARPTEDRSTP